MIKLVFTTTELVVKFLFEVAIQPRRVAVTNHFLKVDFKRFRASLDLRLQHYLDREWLLTLCFVIVCRLLDFV